MVITSLKLVNRIKLLFRFTIKTLTSFGVVLLLERQAVTQQEQTARLLTVEMMVLVGVFLPADLVNQLLKQSLLYLKLEKIFTMLKSLMVFILVFQWAQQTFLEELTHTPVVHQEQNTQKQKWALANGI